MVGWLVGWLVGFQDVFLLRLADRGRSWTRLVAHDEAPDDERAVGRGGDRRARAADLRREGDREDAAPVALEVERAFQRDKGSGAVELSFPDLDLRF